MAEAKYELKLYGETKEVPLLGKFKTSEYQYCPHCGGDMSVTLDSCGSPGLIGFWVRFECSNGCEFEEDSIDLTEQVAELWQAQQAGVN